MIKVIINNNIAAKIEEYQKRTGSTKTWIANQIGVSKQALYTFAKSENPTIETMIKLAVVLDCDINDLLTIEIFEDENILKITRDKFIINLK